MAINRGTFDKLSTLKASFPVVDSGDYAEVLETQLTYVFSGSGWNPGTPAAYTNEFIELVDVLSDYTGKGRKSLAVKSDETGVVFTSDFGESTFGDGGDNYSEFEPDGTLKFTGDAEVWDDIIISASNLRPGNTPPIYAAFQGGIYGARFDAGVADEVYGSFEIPHDYREGGDLYVHAHWSPTTTNTGNIVWGIEFSVANSGETFLANDTKTGTPVPTPGIVGQHVFSNVYIIPGTLLKIGAIVAFRFFRQNGGTDTFTGNAFLHSIGVHYQIDTIGSRQIATK